MNWKKLTIGITIVNILAWSLLELWSYRYADSNVSTGAILLIVFHLIGYYITVIGSRVEIEKREEEKPITPETCPGHDWHPSKHSFGRSEMCIICKAERGLKQDEYRYS